jgi:putative tryptophan/tyrosine transport system substrate-binding protein
VKRREFIAGLGGAAAWPLVARAEQEKIWRIGYLQPGFLDSGPDAALFEAFKQQLTTLGYLEGKNLVIDKRAAEGKNDRLPALANELVALHPNVVVAVATPAIAAVQRATSTIPIVMSPSGDPVGFGFVKSLAHPGGNITGLANMVGDFTAKALEILHTVVPDAKKIAVLMSSNPTHPPLYQVASNAAQVIGLSTVPIIAATAADLDRAFQDIGRANCDAVFVLADPVRPSIVTLAAAARIPGMYQFSEYVEAGGLASYGPIVQSIFTRSAQYVDMIFKGADPADLPVEQPTSFELALNLKTAKSLGLSIPEAVILRADKVVE